MSNPAKTAGRAAQDNVDEPCVRCLALIALAEFSEALYAVAG